MAKLIKSIASCQEERFLDVLAGQGERNEASSAKKIFVISYDSQPLLEINHASSLLENVGSSPGRQLSLLWSAISLSAAWSTPPNVPIGLGIGRGFLDLPGYLWIALLPVSPFALTFH
ncbi:MAG: hypothetical protein HY313_10700 [Acidobacteria bacterium]|nr:hypothetical protein [Acidobacteriota bacterium]